MDRSIYLVNPASDSPSYWGGEVFRASGFRPIAPVADLAVATLAAFVPPDFHVELVDEHVQPVDFDHPARFVGITGKVTQLGGMRRIAQEFRRRGKQVLIGGPCASLDPEALRPHADILVCGEIEEIAERLFADLRRGRWEREYVGTRPDLGLSPVPRWDLYPNQRAQIGCVQTSRGCPYDCEFCDVIQYLGRKQRHKEVEQILAELDLLYSIGYRMILLSDDNFTVYRRRARQVLEALIEWNARRREGRVIFATQVSIDIAKDPQLLELCSEAGLSVAFIGIETPNEASLREAQKRQNIGGNLVEQVETIVDHGIMVTAGMVVGFDHDGPDIFERQYEFGMRAPIPNLMMNALVAMVSTPLHDRLRAEGRLVESDSPEDQPGRLMRTNFLHKRMDRSTFDRGMRWLTNNLYSIDAFGARLENMLQRFGSVHRPSWARSEFQRGPLREVDLDVLRLMRHFARTGRAEERLFAQVARAVRQRPEASHAAMLALTAYLQTVHMYRDEAYWEPGLVGTPAPIAP